MYGSGYGNRLTLIDGAVAVVLAGERLLLHDRPPEERLTVKKHQLSVSYRISVIDRYHRSRATCKLFTHSSNCKRLTLL